MAAAGEKKSRAVLVTAAVLGILGTLVAGGRYLLTPWFVAAASDVMAETIDQRIEDKTKPANNGIKAMLSANIEQLTDEVNMLAARRSRNPSAWTDLDVMMLSNTERRLNSAIRALAEFERQAGHAGAGK